MVKYSSVSALKAIAMAMQNYYNSTGTKSCVNMTRDQPDFAASPGWDYIAYVFVFSSFSSRSVT